MEWLPLALVMAAGLAIVVVRWPVAGALGLYALVLPFDSVLVAAHVGQIHIHVTWLVGAAAVCIVFAAGLLGHRLVRPPRAALWLCLLVLWASFSFAWAINQQAAVFRLPVLALLLLMYLAAVSVRITDKELRMVAWMAVLGGCLAGAVSLYGFVHGQWWSAAGEAQLQAQAVGRETLQAGERVTNPNTLGATLILPLSLAVSMYLSTRTRSRRLLLVAILAVIAASILATMSRGTLLAALVVLLVYLRRWRAKLRVLLPIAMLGVLAAVMPGLLLLRLGQSTVDRGAGRLDIWAVGLQAFQHYALLGAGLDCFPDAYNQYISSALNFVRFTRAPHNIYLGTAVELGIIGLVLLLAAAADHLLLLRKAREAARDDVSRLPLISYEAAAWGLLTCGAFLDLQWEGYFWLVFMLIVMAVRSRSALRQPHVQSWPQWAPARIASVASMNARLP